MKRNLKSEKGAITLVVLIGMLFLTAFLMSMYIQIANRAQNSAETTKQIEEQYNNLNEANALYDSYFANTNVIPIYTKEQLAKIGSGEQILINNKVYTFSTSGYYTIQNDLKLGGIYNESTGTWSGTQWTPLTSTFTGTLDGLGHTITGLYINNSSASNQGLFGTLKGTVKNLNIQDSYIKANSYVGSIAGENQGTIINCHNTSPIIGNTNVTGGYFKSITTGEQIDVWSDEVLEENAYFVSGPNTATAPKGFKVSKNVFEQTISEGMVIQDEEGNEFVWIPVEVTENDTEIDIKAFKRSSWENNERVPLKETYTQEPYDLGYTDGNGTEEIIDFNNMVKSVYYNKGFYIGRYEAGCEIPRTRFREYINGTSTQKVYVQKDYYPYNFVGWGSTMINYEDDVIHNYSDGRNYYQGKGAMSLSKNMYENKNTGIVSTLCYGTQWDAMLDFIKSKVDVTNSTSWGNYYDSDFIITRTTAQYWQSKTGKWENIPASGLERKDITSGYILLTTGASEQFRVNNIYDVAGNVYETIMAGDKRGNE